MFGWHELKERIPKDMFVKEIGLHAKNTIMDHF